MKIDRRTLLRTGLTAMAGAAVGAAAVSAPHLFEPKHLPFDGGYAPAADRVDYERDGHLDVLWYVRTDDPVVALTFDDGPGPKWTSMVLDTLDQYQTPATFFMVGSRLSEHYSIVEGRLGRHEVGNHTWSHPDLAKLDASGVRKEINRAHEAIQRYTGREAHLLRPPYGHLGGSTLMAADSCGYNLVLWSQQMHEATYRRHPEGQVDDILEHTRPGQIILAHDVGSDDRLVALRHLGEMISGLRQRGFRFVTVSDLLSVGSASPSTGQRAPIRDRVVANE